MSKEMKKSMVSYPLRSDGKAYIIAEIGINHNGEISKALELIDAAAACGADAVKFQTFRTEILIPRGQPRMPYQHKDGESEDQFDMLKRVELSEKQHVLLIDYCRKVGVDFISTPYDPGSADLLFRLGVKILKVASTDTTNILFLRHLRKLGLPLIISTGITGMDELQQVMKVFNDSGLPIVILQCVSNYPAPMAELNLRSIRSLEVNFGYPVGFSDHSASLLTGAYAVCAGAKMLEKHFTFDKAAWGPDHSASVTPEELREYIRNVREAELVLGDGTKRVMPSESQVKKHMQKSICAERDLAAGDVLSDENLWAMRPATGIPALEIDRVVGRKLKVSKRKFEQIHYEDII